MISAVVFVSIVSSVFDYSFQKRANKPLIIENPYPSVSLTLEQRYMLEQIDFNQVGYGSNLEHWDKTNGDVESIKLNKYTQILKQSFGIATENFNYDPKYPFSVEIPCDPFTCLLTGLINNTKFWGDNDSCEIKIFIDNAIVLTHPITNIELINTDSRYREGSLIKIDFGAACFTRIRNTSLVKNSQYYLNNNLDGTISVAIDADFILSILTSTKNVEELWISEGQKELYKSLKEMVDNRQKIIGLSLVQDSLNSDTKTHVVFLFGAVTNTLIREDKSVLNEEKKLKKLRRSNSKEK
ncbi:hypothetical protein [Chamaesiphon sp. OTE_75_metabat_556]|uniref:hypothetical protein n=1 Tax=Chamaesiphon sp. OTE_75_metabat_556 TaxID=2964692 RepID=UPI00286C7D78|nr:hypothetical protein [Chamaesiphon sp. OTE_75_metabat_556]